VVSSGKLPEVRRRATALGQLPVHAMLRQASSTSSDPAGASHHWWNSELPHWILGSITLALATGLSVYLMGLYLGHSYIIQYELAGFFGVPLAFLSSFGYLRFHRRKSWFFSSVAWITAIISGGLITWIILLAFLFRGA
jgi:hypothetical protein